jgi:hypothetical protein
MFNPPSFVYINSTNMLMPTTVITKQILISFITTIKNIINIFFDDLCIIIKAIILTAIVYAAYNKFMEMDRTVQYVIKMDQMRQNEWEKMMKMQSKICTELKKEFDNKITVYKMDTDKKIKKCKKI